MNEPSQTVGALIRTLVVAAGIVLLAAPVWGAAVLLGVYHISPPTAHSPGIGILFIALIGVTICVSPLAILLGCLIPGRSDLPTVPPYRVVPGRGVRVVCAVVLFLTGPVLGWLLGTFFQAIITGLLAPPAVASLLALSAIERTDHEPDSTTASSLP